MYCHLSITLNVPINSINTNPQPLLDDPILENPIRLFIMYMLISSIYSSNTTTHSWNPLYSPNDLFQSHLVVQGFVITYVFLCFIVYTEVLYGLTRFPVDIFLPHYTKTLDSYCKSGWLISCSFHYPQAWQGSFSFSFFIPVACSYIEDNAWFKCGEENHSLGFIFVFCFYIICLSFVSLLLK